MVCYCMLCNAGNLAAASLTMIFGFRWGSAPPSATLVSAEPFSHGTGTLRCLQKEMATYRYWSVSLWRDQTMSHIVESCPLTKLNGGLSRLHSADEDAVSWLTNYGKWHAYEKKKKTYKVALLCHKVRTTATPMYLSELVQTHAPPGALRSSDAPLLVVPRIHTKLARRTFSVAAPSTSNSLPADIRLYKNIPTFKCHLSVQTHLVLLCCLKLLYLWT